MIPTFRHDLRYWGLRVALHNLRILLTEDFYRSDILYRGCPHCMKGTSHERP